MKLYFQYLNLTLSNAFKNPKRALKIIPGLGFLLIGLAILVFQIITPPNEKAVELVNQTSQNIGIIYLVAISTFILIIQLVGVIFNTGLGFRAADANYLMKAPVTPFDAFIFISMKQMVLMIGLGFFMSGTQASGIKQLVAQNDVLIISSILFVITTYVAVLISYLSLYFKLKNKKVTLLIYIPLILILFGYLIYSAINSGANFVRLTEIHLIPLLGWSFGIYSHYIAGNTPLALLYGFGYILFGIILYVICKKLTFDYYEFELSKVAKTEARIQKAFSAKANDPKLFVKSTKTLKNVGAKSIIDIENIRMGKYWFISLSNIFKFLFAIGAPVFANYIMKESGILLILIPLGMVFAIRMYFYSFTLFEGKIFKDFYLKLFPIKTWKKVIYSNIVSLKITLLESILFIVSLIISTQLINQYSFDLHLITLSFIAYLLLGISEIITSDNIIPYLSNRIGNTLALIINIAQTALKAGLIFWVGFIIYSHATQEILLLYLILLLSVSSVFTLTLTIFIYNKTDFTKYNS